MPVQEYNFDQLSQLDETKYQEVTIEGNKIRVKEPWYGRILSYFGRKTKIDKEIIDKIGESFVETIKDLKTISRNTTPTPDTENLKKDFTYLYQISTNLRTIVDKIAECEITSDNEIKKIIMHDNNRRTENNLDDLLSFASIEEGENQLDAIKLLEKLEKILVDNGIEDIDIIKKRCRLLNLISIYEKNRDKDIFLSAVVQLYTPLEIDTHPNLWFQLLNPNDKSDALKALFEGEVNDLKAIKDPDAPLPIKEPENFDEVEMYYNNPPPDHEDLTEKVNTIDENAALLSNIKGVLESYPNIPSDEELLNCIEEHSDYNTKENYNQFINRIVKLCIDKNPELQKDNLELSLKEKIPFLNFQKLVLLTKIQNSFKLFPNREIPSNKELLECIEKYNDDTEENYNQFIDEIVELWMKNNSKTNDEDKSTLIFYLELNIPFEGNSTKS